MDAAKLIELTKGLESLGYAVSCFQEGVYVFGGTAGPKTGSITVTIEPLTANVTKRNELE